MNVFQAIILGIVQGLAEFLPISSSGHLILTRALLGISDAAYDTGAYMMLDILLHGGTLIALLVVFRKDWWDILRSPFKSKPLLLLFIASMPALIVALLFGDVIEGMFTGGLLGIAFLITGAFLVLAERLSRSSGKHSADNGKPGFKNAVSMEIGRAHV